MKLKMLMTVPAGVDGEVKEYTEGKEYEFSTESELALARLMLSQKYAHQVDISSTPGHNVSNESADKRVKRRSQKS